MPSCQSQKGCAFGESDGHLLLLDQKEFVDDLNSKLFAIRQVRSSNYLERK